MGNNTVEVVSVIRFKKRYMTNLISERKYNDMDKILYPFLHNAYFVSSGKNTERFIDYPSTFLILPFLCVACLKSFMQINLLSFTIHPHF